MSQMPRITTRPSRTSVSIEPSVPTRNCSINASPQREAARASETAATRSDIEIFFDGLPEPIDLELDHTNRVLYWTDRGDPPRGNTVNRASIDKKPIEPEIVVTHLMEGIGIALDIPNDRMFVTDFAGSIYSARLDGSGERNFLYAQGNLTGIAYAAIPKEK